MSKTVRDVMTTPVVTVRQDTPFKQVVARVRAARVGAVPVTDDSGLVLGIVCEHDLLAKKASPDRPPRARAGQGTAPPRAGQGGSSHRGQPDDQPGGDYPRPGQD